MIIKLSSIFFGINIVNNIKKYIYIQCVAKPDPPLYKGGIIVNPEMNEDMKGYKALGNAKIASGQSPDGNKYAVVSDVARELFDGIAQIINAEKDIIYSFSGKHIIIINLLLFAAW